MIEKIALESNEMVCMRYAYNNDDRTSNFFA